MAAPQLITRDNFTNLLVRSTQPRGSTPDGNVYFDTANDQIQLISLAELATVDLGSGAEANPLTAVDKIQNLALYFFTLQEVEADATLQQFRQMVDAVPNRMGKLVGATSMLNDVKLADGAVDISGVGGELGDDRLKIADSGVTETDVSGAVTRVQHGVKSTAAVNSTTQPYYMLAASLSESARQAATPVDFSKLGNINELVQTFGDASNGNFDSRSQVLVLCAREFGYTIGEQTSSNTGVSELGAYLQGYNIGNALVAEIAALSFADVWTTPVAPWDALTFYRYATGQTRTGFAATGAGTSGNFTDEVQVSSGTLSVTELRAWLDALMLQDTDENANTGVTGVFRPRRAEPLYTIVGGNLTTRAGIWVDPANLTAEAQQNVVFTNDSGGLHTIPFNAGVTIAVSDAWLTDSQPWFRLMYSDADGTPANGDEFDTSGAVTVPDASAVDLAGDANDSRITGNTLSFSYAYDAEDAGGAVAPGVDQEVTLQIGGVDGTKTRTVTFTITRSSSIAVDATTEAETN